MKMALIEWFDPSTCAHLWTHRDDFDEAYVTECISVGLVIRETGGDITLCLSLNERNYSQGLTIPKCCIKRMRTLQIKEEK